MIPYIRTLSLLAGCGLSFLLIPLAEAATVTNEFLLQLVIKQWCEISATHASKETIKEKNTFKITIVQDPQNNGTQTEINGNIANVVGALPFDLEQITVRGVAFLTNNAGTVGEFSAGGVHPGDETVFLSMRGTFFVDKLGVLKKVSGIFVFHSHDPDHCFGDGTFKTTLPLP
jgi:hypothetical protein